MSTDDNLKKKILEQYLESTSKNQTYGLWYHTIGEKLGLDQNLVYVECQFLEDEGFLAKIEMDFGNGPFIVGTRITSNGQKALQTIYNSEWLKEENKKKQDAQDLKIREIKNTENSHTWTKVGVAVAIFLGIISTIFTAFKP